ncbi:MAG: fused MFS/spermidine synthase [Candidatus Polarisedimenticolia bacterium]
MTKADREDRPAQSAVGLLAGAFLLSGAAGLMHEVVWVRLLGHVFGVTAFAVGTVLAAYMGGLALGAWLAGRRAGRLEAPARLYAWIEIGIGLFAVAVPFLLDAIEPLYGWLWRRFHVSFLAFSAVRFVLAGGMLLAPTVMMGATLPLLVEHFARRFGRRAAPEWLYTVNLAGAALGVASAGFLLLPLLGVRGTIAVGALVNIGVGAVVLTFASKGGRADAAAAPAATPSPAPRSPRMATFLLAAAFVSGFTCLASQVAWTRLVSLLIGSTTYAFSTVLLVFLVALAAGSAWVSRRAGDPAGSRRQLAILSLSAAAALTAAVIAVNHWPTWYWRVFSTVDPGSIPGVVAVNVACISIILMLPLLLAGTLFPLTLAAVRAGDPRDAAGAVGRLCAVNTVGAILGSVLGGFVLVPWIGSSGSLKALAWVTAIFAGFCAAPINSARLRPAIGLGVAAVTAALFLAPAWDQKLLNAAIYEPRAGLDPRDKNRKDTIAYHREGPTATVIVMDRPPADRYLRINGRVNGSNGFRDIATNVLLAQIPLLLAPRADDVLVVGLGTGVTAGAALQSPARRVTVVELEPAVVEASRLFDADSHAPLSDPRLRLLADDARHILVASDETFDVIVSEPSHPWVSGVANLFTQDFFRLAAGRLRERGVFAQWLQTYQITPETFQSILATFQSVFPEVMIFRSVGTDLILIGSRQPVPIDLAGMESRWRDPAACNEMARVGLPRPESLLAHFVTGPADVRAMAAAGRINTDDNMLVEFRAPAGVLRQEDPQENDVFAHIASTPVETVLLDAQLLLHRPDSLRALVKALEARRWPADKYQRMLAEL